MKLRIALAGIVTFLAFAAPNFAFGDTLASTAARPGQQIQLQLANGDRLSGEFIWRTDGKIRVRSSILGDLTLNEIDAAILEIPADPVPASDRHQANDLRAGSPGVKAPPAAPDPVPEIISPTPPAAPAAPLHAISAAPASSASAAKSKAIAPAPTRWKGKIELGSVQQSGRSDTLSYNARAEAERKIRRHSLRATARDQYAEQNDKPSADRHDAAFRWRYQLSQRSFAQSHTTYYRDDIIQIQSNLEQNAGLGYRVLDLPRHAVNLGGGATAQYREWDAGTNGWSPYAKIFQDYAFQINDRISFAQDAVLQYSPSDRAFNLPNRSSPATVDPEEQNYKIRLNGTLQGKVTERISVNLRFEYELDNAINLEDARENQRITSLVGYAF